MSASKGKKYALAVLIDLCGGTRAGITETLPWHDLRDDGLWLKEPPAMLTHAERETVLWHPRAHSGQPALPVPFTAPELAAFMLAGGGLFLHERFVGESDRPDEVALAAMGTNAGEAREALIDAFALREEVTSKFDRTDDGVRDAAIELLAPLAQEDHHSPDPISGPTLVHSTRGTRANILTAVVEQALERAGSGASRAQVWAELECIARADDRPPPLVGLTTGGVRYNDGGQVKVFTRRAMDDRLWRRERRAKPR